MTAPGHDTAAAPREASVPALVVRPDLASPLDVARERRAHAPEHVAFALRTRDGLAERTLGDFLGAVDAVAAGLVRRGMRRGDRAAVLGATSYAWALAEWSIWRAGGVVVPIYETSAPSAITTLLARVDARFVIADAAGAARMRDADASVPVLEMGEDEEIIARIGVRPAPEELEELDARAPGREDDATIVFTSGTGGEPHGVVIAHGSLVDLALNVQAAWSEVLDEHGRTVIFLPLAHILARGLQIVCLWAGMRITYLSDPGELVASLPELRPTFLVVVPRVLEKIVEAAGRTAREARIGPLWRDAENVAVAWGRALEEADRRSACRARSGSAARRAHTGSASRPAAAEVPRRVRARRAVYERLFYRRIRAQLGGSMEILLSGAAPLDPRLSWLFRGMGLPVMEGYGLTETTAPLAGNRPHRIRSGTVGEIVPGTAVRIDDDGLIWVRGVGVASRFLDPEQTAAAFRDGWLCTGDLGSLDADGFLTVTGRQKDVIVTAGGKNVSPAPWEAEAARDPIVAEAVVVGDARPYLVALLLLDREALARELGIRVDPAADGSAVEVTDPAVLERLSATVESANAAVSRAESVKRFRALVVDLSESSGLTTPTLKLRREATVERLADVVDALYAERS